MPHWYILKAFRSRLAQRITLWVFCSLLAIEAIILVPSYLRREQEQLTQLNLLATTSINAAIQDSETIDILMATKLFQHLKADQLILGGAIYTPEGQIMIGYSQFPDTESFKAIQASSGTHYDRLRHTYDVAIQARPEASSPFIVIRYNAIPVRQDLNAYAGRMVSMIVLISVVVTLGTMAGVERIVIRPVLYLQNDLLTAGKSLQDGIRNPNFSANQLHCPNELGEVITAFKTLYKQIWQATQQQEVAYSLEKQERDRADKLTETLDQLHQTQAQLVQVEKMAGLGQLAAGMAHEINNPITFIHSNISPLENYVEDLLALLDAYQQEQPETSPQIQQLINQIDLDFLKEDYPKIIESFRSGTHRIKKIIEALKKFSRLDESGIKAVDLKECLSSTLTLLHNRLITNTNRPEIEVIQTHEPLPLVSCQPELINQVFLNILTNAIEALDRHPNPKEPPTIWIQTRQIDDDWIQIQFSNNGPVLSEIEHQKLFNPFFTTKPIGEGTGISLFSSYQIIYKQHRGRLSCTSLPGEKVTFLIELPIEAYPVTVPKTDRPSYPTNSNLMTEAPSNGTSATRSYEHQR